MNFNIKTTPMEPKTEPTSDEILVAQQVVNQGVLHGLASCGGKRNIGNFIIEFVNDGSQFTTVQIYQCALGITPKVQSWNKTKTVVQKKTIIKEVVKKPTKIVKEKVEFKNLGVEEF